MTTQTHLLQHSLRQEQQAGTLNLPPLERWNDGTTFWGELVCLSLPEVEDWRHRAQRSSQLAGPPPQQGIQLCAESPLLSQRLARKIDQDGYGGLVQFDDLEWEDCFLRVMVGSHLYPIIVADRLLQDFWAQVTLRAGRHFLTVIDQEDCLGFWESDVILAR